MKWSPYLEQYDDDIPPTEPLIETVAEIDDPMGYKCPYNICVFRREEHLVCLNTKRRLFENFPGYTDDNTDWFETFKYNWNIWLTKTHDQILDRALG